MCCFFFARSLSVSHHFFSSLCLYPQHSLHSASEFSFKEGIPPDNTQSHSGPENVYTSNAPRHWNLLVLPCLSLETILERYIFIFISNRGHLIWTKTQVWLVV